MSIAPTFSGEVQFRRYSDTSTQGQQIVLQVEDRAALEPFIGKEGKRFMAVLVEIGDDEKPVPPPAEKPLKEGPRRTQGPICRWLALRCRERAFQEWVASEIGVVEVTEEVAAINVRAWCGVGSRSDIDGDPKAEALFEKSIRRPWLAHTKQATTA
jgi:hypothetical protein